MCKLDHVIEEDADAQQSHKWSEVGVEFDPHTFVHGVGVALEKQDEGHEETYKGQEYHSVSRRHHTLTHFKQG